MPIRSSCSDSLSSSFSVISASSSSGEDSKFAAVAATGSTSSSGDLHNQPLNKENLAVALLIPSYQPSGLLPALLRSFLSTGETAGWDTVVVVDDGSGPAYAKIFEELRQIPGVIVIANAVNLGKGAALKLGINFLLCASPNLTGIITADADGQHDPRDVWQVRESFLSNPDSLVLGVRKFDGPVPLRSKFGNRATRLVMRAILGQKLTDSQTGLRAIPRSILEKLLKVASSGYEFELEMLVAVKHLGVPVREQPIRTIYEPSNPSSHFHPLRDSMRIYAVLLRFGFISILTAALDNFVFYMLFQATGGIAISQLGARFAAVLLNYSAIRRAVFHSSEKHQILAPRYLAVVLINGLLSYIGIQLLTALLPIQVFPAKVLAEALLFVGNFIVQRDFVFSKPYRRPTATDWDNYYHQTPFFARFTRLYTQRILISAMQRFSAAPTVGSLTILEFGGANSCFLDAILCQLRPALYQVVDQNEYGLSLLSERTAIRKEVSVRQGDVLSKNRSEFPYDIVFSVGLIEHFDVDGTRRAIESHFDCLKEGGIAVITYPTPTWLYLLVRGIAESFNLWRFPDERALGRKEVLEIAAVHGQVLFEKTLWPLFLTQGLVVVRKTRAAT